MSLEELRKAIKQQDLTYGTEQTLKNLKLSKVKVVFLASNCPQEVRDNVTHYAELANAKIMELEIPDEEVGVLCKKRHSVSVLSY
jgi:large subunit ribosomal protein L30e